MHKNFIGRTSFRNNPSIGIILNKVGEIDNGCSTFSIKILGERIGQKMRVWRQWIKTLDWRRKCGGR